MSAANSTDVPASSSSPLTVGVCWPSPGANRQTLFDGRVLDLLRESTGATHLRVNLDHRRQTDELISHIEHIRSHGWEILPIIDFDYDDPDPTDYALTCAALTGLFPVVELGNEPHIMHGMKPQEYAEVFIAGASACRTTSPHTKILIACEATKPICRRIDYFAKVMRYVPPALVDGIAIHPYRNPMPTQHTSFGTRDAEAQYYRSQAPGKSLHVTEVGWDLRSGVTEDLQAEYIYQELMTWQSLGAESVYVYAYTEAANDTRFRFGILDSDLRPRPVAAAIKRFQ